VCLHVAHRPPVAVEAVKRIAALVEKEIRSHPVLRKKSILGSISFAAMGLSDLTLKFYISLSDRNRP